MSKRETPGPSDALLAWLGPLGRFAQFGTELHPRSVRRRLAIVNLMALTIAVFSVVYSFVFAAYGLNTYWPLIARQCRARGRRAARAARPPHQRRRRRALICFAEYIALFFFVRELGHEFRHSDQFHHRRRGRLRRSRPTIA